jgi:hypothetical protein
VKLWRTPLLIILHDRHVCSVRIKAFLRGPPDGPLYVYFFLLGSERVRVGQSVCACPRVTNPFEPTTILNRRLRNQCAMLVPDVHHSFLMAASR